MLKPKISDPGVTRHILKTFGLHASKRLGQNFLIQDSIVQAITAAAEIQPGDRVLEIGPGIGTLTQGMAEAGAVVTAVEIDKKLPDVLAETLAGYDQVRIVCGDILKTDIPALMGKEPFKVVANLPYYITTPILLHLLEQRLSATRIVTMVQREVAERMIAVPGGRDYGALSVAVQYYTRPRLALAVPPRCFLPSPAVESAAVECVVRESPAVAVSNERRFFQVVRAAFGQRRKTLGNALRTLGISRDMIQNALKNAGINAIRRGETLSLEEFAALTETVLAAEK